MQQKYVFSYKCVSGGRGKFEDSTSGGCREINRREPGDVAMGIRLVAMTAKIEP